MSRKPKNPVIASDRHPRPPLTKITKVMMVALVVLAILFSYTVGENNGKNSEKNLLATAYQAAYNKQVSATCTKVFGATTTIESTFKVNSISLNTATSNVTGQVVCAYHVGKKSLVLIAVNSKPSSLVGKNGVTSENVVTYRGTHGQVWVIAASTDSNLKMTKFYDAYLFSVAMRV